MRLGMPPTLQMISAEIADAGNILVALPEPPAAALHHAPWDLGHTVPEAPPATSTASRLNGSRGKSGYSLALVLAAAAVCATIWAMVFVAAMNRGGDLQDMRTESAEKAAEARQPLEYIRDPSASGGLSDEGNVNSRRPKVEAERRRSSWSSSQSTRSTTTAYSNLDDVREWTIDITDDTTDGSVAPWTSEGEAEDPTSTRPSVKRAYRRTTHRRHFKTRKPFRRHTTSRLPTRADMQLDPVAKEDNDIGAEFLVLMPKEGRN